MSARRAASWMGGALVPASVLVVDPSGWYPFDAARWWLVSVLCLASITLTLMGGVIRFESKIAVAGGGLVLAMGLAAAVGLDPWYAWVGTPERHAGVLLWAICVAMAVVGLSLDDPTPVHVGTAVAGVGLGVVATAEALGWEPSVFDVSTRLSATLGSPAYLGAAAALLLPVAVGAVLAGSRGTQSQASARPMGEQGWNLALVKRPWFLVVASATGGLLVAVVGSGARAAWVGLSVASVAVLRAQRHRLARHTALAPDRARFVVVVVAIAAVVAGGLLVTPIGGRLASLADHDAPGGLTRIDEWRVAARVIAAHPVIGTGPEGYRIAFAEGVDRAYQDRHGRDPIPDRAHSSALDVAATGGTMALVGWAAGLIVILARYGRRALGSGDPVQIGLGAGLVAHWVGQILLFPLAELEPVAWLLAGVMVATQARPGEVRQLDFGIGLGRCRRLGAQVAVGLIGMLATAALVVGGTGVAADRWARTAASTGSVEAAHRAVSLRPDVIRYHLLEAHVLVGAGQGYRAALSALDAGLAISPRDPVLEVARARFLVRLALATELPADREEAASYLVKLRSRDPYNDELSAIEGELSASRP